MRWRLWKGKIMAEKSYKQLYEETKFMLAKYQDEIVPGLREQALSEEEIFALRAVAYGCNTNKKLALGHFLDRKTDKTVSFEDALVTVYKLLERCGADI